MKVDRLKERFKNYISKESNTPIAEEDENSFNFTSNGLKYVFETFDDDPYYFRLVLPNILTIDESNKSWIENQIDKLSINIKDARLVKNSEKVSAIADSFVYSPENIDYLFKRVISCLVTLYEELRKNYIDEYKNK